MNDNEKPILTFRNEIQAKLWEELDGQISDGMWENTRPYNHWKPWCNAEVLVDPKNVGRNFYADKDNYDFNNSQLLSIVGDRMLASCQELVPDFTMAQMRAELRDMKKIVRIRTTFPEVAPEPVVETPVAAKPQGTVAQIRSMLTDGETAISFLCPDGVDLKVFAARIASAIGHTPDLKGKFTTAIDREVSAVIVDRKVV